MFSIVLAGFVTAAVLLISSITSPRLRTLIYVLPIPITILLVAIGNGINTTHLTGLANTLLFVIIFAFLYQRLRVNPIFALILCIAIYILVGWAFSPLASVDFLLAFGLFSLVWLLQLIKPIKIDHKHYQKIDITLNKQDYIIRAIAVFSLVILITKLQPYILGAAITFPVNTIFVAYIMRDNIQVLAAEFARNIQGLAVYFLAVYFAQPELGLALSIFLAWISTLLSYYLINRYVPRIYKS